MLTLLFAFLSVHSAFAGTPSFRNVVMIVLENASYNSAMKQPFLSKLAQEGALLTACKAERHPSQPNYIAMIAGDTLGVATDSNVDLVGDHLGNLLDKRGLTWKVYAEDYPGDCFLGSSQGKYVRKHVPFLSFKSVQSDPRQCAKIVSSTQFQADVTAGTLPTFSMYVPNLNHDGHDTGVSAASQWLGAEFGALLSNANFMKETLFIVTFDEDDRFSGNQVYTVLYGANVQSGSQVSAPTSHYSVLRTLEDALHLGTLGKNDSKVAPITGIWK